MANAEAAEAKLTELLRSEVIKVDKECVRPLQVSTYSYGGVDENGHRGCGYCRWRLSNAVPGVVKISPALRR